MHCNKVSRASAMLRALTFLECVVSWICVLNMICGLTSLIFFFAQRGDRKQRKRLRAAALISHVSLNVC